MIKQTITTRVAVIVSLLSLIISVGAFSLGFLVAGELTKLNSNTMWDSRLLYACYNNKIQPCDDAGVSKWNSDNPDQAITTDYLRGQ